LWCTRGRHRRGNGSEHVRGAGLVTTPGGTKNALLSAARPVVFTTVISMVGVKTMARTRPGLSPPPSTFRPSGPATRPGTDSLAALRSAGQRRRLVQPNVVASREFGAPHQLGNVMVIVPAGLRLQ
jgi:hypothetical protein